MRSRWLGATIAGAVAVLAGSCTDDDDGVAGQATLPAIQTTTTVAAPAAASTTQPRFYEVQRGDTLFAIADAYGLPIPAIMEMNGITDPNQIYAGQILELPLASEVVSTSLPTATTATTAPGPTALPPITAEAP